MDIPTIENSALVVVDMQEKLLPAMNQGECCTEKVKTLIAAAGAMNLPVAVTEQYPKGLGATLPQIAELFPEGTAVIEKCAFSCYGEAAFAEQTAKYENLILCGVESHVCVAQTALDAMKLGKNVFLIKDAVTSRKESDKDAAMDFLTAQGVRILTTEMILFMLMRTSKHPAFKAVSKLIK